MSAGRSLSDFRAAHDPTLRVGSPEDVYERPLGEAKRFIVTCAQNATPVHESFWNTLRFMADQLGAEILVIPVRYKNPTSHWSGSQRNAEYWVPEVRPFLWNTRKSLNRNLMVLGDLKIQPTAADPLTGADAISHAASGIIGHPKVQLRSIPTPSQSMAKLLMTTGACTVENYTDSRAGKIGAFHHSLSAILVEVDGTRFFARHIHWDGANKCVHDLEKRYTATQTVGVGIAALVMGDTHVDFIDPAVERATFGPGGMVEVLRPKHLVWHDLLDAYSCNPHHVGNPFAAVAKRKVGADDVEAEVLRAIEFIRKRTPKRALSIVVGSNHDDMFRRWILRTDWRQDPTNAEFYLATALAMVRGTKLTPHGTQYPDPFVHWVRDANLPRVHALGRSESFTLHGVELGMHGDAGPNGARGSAKNLRRIGVRSIIGHSHSPVIDEGCYQTGTSTALRLEYNGGPSAWMNCHCVLHTGGKRQLVFIIGGKWRA